MMKRWAVNFYPAHASVGAFVDATNAEEAADLAYAKLTAYCGDLDDLFEDLYVSVSINPDKYEAEER